MNLVGVVGAELEAVVVLQVFDATGQSHRIDAAIDTGFTGYLTLPPSLIQALNLKFIASSTVELADGSITTLAKHEAALVWGSQRRRIPVLRSDTRPLLGMLLLRDCVVSIDVRPGREVRVTASE